MLKKHTFKYSLNDIYGFSLISHPGAAALFFPAWGAHGDPLLKHKHKRLLFLLFLTNKGVKAERGKREEKGKKERIRGTYFEQLRLIWLKA